MVGGAAGEFDSIRAAELGDPALGVCGHLDAPVGNECG